MSFYQLVQNIGPKVPPPQLNPYKKNMAFELPGLFYEKQKEMKAATADTLGGLLQSLEQIYEVMTPGDKKLHGSSLKTERLRAQTLQGQFSQNNQAADPRNECPRLFAWNELATTFPRQIDVSRNVSTPAPLYAQAPEPQSQLSNAERERLDIEAADRLFYNYESAVLADFEVMYESYKNTIDKLIEEYNFAIGLLLFTDQDPKRALEIVKQIEEEHSKVAHLSEEMRDIIDHISFKNQNCALRMENLKKQYLSSYNEFLRKQTDFKLCILQPVELPHDSPKGIDQVHFIHIATIHGGSKIPEDSQVLDSVVRSQLKTIEMIRRYPNARIHQEGCEHSLWMYETEQRRINGLTAKMVEDAFKEGIPENFENLSTLQKNYLFLWGGARILQALGEVAIYKTSHKKAETHIRRKIDEEGDGRYQYGPREQEAILCVKEDNNKSPVVIMIYGGKHDFRSHAEREGFTYERLHAYEKRDLVIFYARVLNLGKFLKRIKSC